MPVENGLLILDKPAGPTSREIVEQVRKLLGVKLAGHVGTLDPNATGVLPILLGRATRVAPALERLDKEYVAVVHLHRSVSDDELQTALEKFIGTIKQIPPVKSAVVRRERERRVYSIDVLGREGNDVRLRVVCEAGTYVRKLASDIGNEIGGAHLKGLRRTRSGPFGEKDCHAMEELQNALGDDSSLRRIILPIERAVAHIPNIVVKDSSIPVVMHGSPISTSGIVKVNSGMQKGELVAILSVEGELLALGYAVAEDLTRNNVIIVQIDRVVKA
jgi:H/ACA ribonucleoprotein complex subunit 4